MNHFDFVVEFLGQMNELLRPIDHFLPARGGLLIVIRDRDDLVLPSDSSYTGFQSKRPSVLWPRARPFCFDCPKKQELLAGGRSVSINNDQYLNAPHSRMGEKTARYVF